MYMKWWRRRWATERAWRRSSSSFRSSAPAHTALHLSASLLRDSAASQDLPRGRIVHSFIVSCSFTSNVLLSNLLLQMYGSCSDLEDAYATFCSMRRRNLLSWNYMLSVSVHQQVPILTLKLFRQMQLEGVYPNKHTFIITLFASSACQIPSLLSCQNLQTCIVELGFASDVFCGTAIVTVYGRYGLVKHSITVFDSLLERTTVSWNALISSLVCNGYHDPAAQSFQQMMLEGALPSRATFLSLFVDGKCANFSEGRRLHALVSASELYTDITLQNSLVNFYGKHGKSEEVLTIFVNISEPTIITYNAMISVYVQEEMYDSCYQTFQRIHEECIFPNNVTFVSMVSMCASVGALSMGRLAHARLVCSGLVLDIVLRTALINMYGKCGDIISSEHVFAQMHCRNIMSWNTMLAAYAQHGQGMKAISCFRNMQLMSSTVDATTFLSLLSACSHAGLVDQSLKYFYCMRHHFGMEPMLEHYHCILDLLGHAGRLDEASYLLKRMPFDPTGTTWMTLLAACRMHLDIEQGLCAAENVCICEPQNPAPYLMLPGIHTTIEDFDHKNNHLLSGIS